MFCPQPPVLDVLPSAPVLDVLPSAPVLDVLPSAPEPDQTTKQQEEQEQEKVVIPPAKVFSKPLPWVASLILFPFFWYLCSLGSPVEAFTAFDCQNRSNRVTAYSLIEPESCHGHVANLRYVRVLSAEII